LIPLPLSNRRMPGLFNKNVDIYLLSFQKLSNLKYLSSKSSRTAFYSYGSLHFYIQSERESTKELSLIWKYSYFLDWIESSDFNDLSYHSQTIRNYQQIDYRKSDCKDLYISKNGYHCHSKVLKAFDTEKESKYSIYQNILKNWCQM